MLGRIAHWTRRVRGRSLHLVGAAALAGTAALTLAASTAAASEGLFGDQSGGAFQILAPGEEGGFIPGTDSTNQGILYDKLTALQGNITTKELAKYYLSEKFGVTGAIVRTETPIAGLKIERDVNDIPHIFGETRAEAMYGSGWVAAAGPRAAAAARPRSGVRGGAERPGRERRSNCCSNGRSFTPSAQASSSSKRRSSR